MKNRFILLFLSLLIFFVSLTGCSFFSTKEEKESYFQEQPYHAFIVHEDRQKIYLGKDDTSSNDGQIVLTIEQLPTESSLSKGVNITADGFQYVVLSPNEQLIAFSTFGKNSWNGMFNLVTKEIKELSLVNEKEIAGLPYWSGDNAFIVFENISQTPTRFLQVIDINNQKQNFVIRSVSLDNPQKLPIDIYAPEWSSDNLLIRFKAMIIEKNGGKETNWQTKRDNTGIEQIL